jgi:hypothetical protein
MAVKYNGNKAVLSGMREDVVAPNDFWQDFTKFLTQADYYNTAFKGNYDSYFGGLTADWDAQDYQNFFNANGITDAVQGNSNVDISKITDLNKLKAIMGSMVIDQKGHFSNNKYKLPSTEINKLKEGIKAYNAHNQLVTNLRNKGGTDEQIQAILDSRDGSADSYTTLYDDVADLSGDAWNSYIADNFAKNNVLPDNTWGSGTTAYTIDNATLAVANPTSTADSAQQAVDTSVLGKSSLDDLRNTPGFVEENGKYYLNQLDEDGNPVKDASGNPVRQEFAVDKDNNQIVYVGGDKSGDRWSVPGTSKADTVDQMGEDERAAYESIKGLTEEYGKFGRDTLAAIDAPENDFAGQINAQLNQFLNGYTGTDGKPVKGFLDYQSDLEGAGQTLKTDMQGLQKEYDQAYASYEGELDPLRTQMGTITDMSMDVARDANDQNYYTRLKDTLYADAQESINRSASGARDTLNQTYANAGLDPSSPAFTAAMRDLAKSRADSERSANRQAILDSYGLGSQMLTNRSNALTGASNAIGAEMGALDSLYGVKLQGLNNRKDMIGQIYNVDRNNATVGMQGLNTLLDTGLKGISANQTQFNKNIDLTNSIYSNLINAQSGIRNLADQEGRTAEGDLIDFSNAGKSDDFTYGSFELALQQAYPDGNIPDSLKALLDKYNPNK